jgi:exodeoxyribonuclease VII large subunit
MAAEIAVPAREDILARLASLESSALSRLRTLIAVSSRRVAELSRSYALGQVRGRIESAMQRLDHACGRAARAAAASIRQREARLETAAARLSGMDPREVLRRGYSVCLDPRTGRGVSGVADAVRVRDVRLVFHDGSARARVQGMSGATPVRWESS